jgi:hypothetical protein
MLGANPFFKRPAVPMPMPSHHGSRHFEGNLRYGFDQSLMPSDVKTPAPLPTRPAIVGGNVDWTKAVVTPATQYLHSVLSGGRPMNPPPALGSLLRLGEPNVNSIHTSY